MCTWSEVAALRAADKAGAKTVAIVGKPESTLAREAIFVIPYDNGAIYGIPILAVLKLLVK